MSNLLVELFVEELPPKALKTLGERFAIVLADMLATQGLRKDASVLTHFASPRRLAVHVTQVLNKAADQQVAQKLMPVSVGLDANGHATPALLKRLQALGLEASSVANLRQQQDGKANVLFLDVTQAGASLVDGLQKALDEALARLPIPKVMTYQLHQNTHSPGWESVNFVRPAHGLVALHGAEVVPVRALGLQAGNTTQGHRFEAKQAVITLVSADSYADQLHNEGAVIASFEARKAEIIKQLNATASQVSLRPIEDEALLDEVTALVERPNVLLCQFEEDFLAVPQECLILTMKANQKYFPLLDANNKLTNKFLIVSNISPQDPSKVIGGNERVVRPRLADAKFFFDQDRKKTLESRLEGLNKVVYHNQLGSQGERNTRVITIALAIAKLLGRSELLAKVEQAARLCKADLLTDMVGEFPELQGIMGRYYAQYEGLGDDVAYAIEDHYKPRFSNDELPRSLVGVIIALADKLETLVGLFSIGEKPTGDKDPFGLRRHALGVTKMLIEKTLPLDMTDLIKCATSAFSTMADEPILALRTFFYDRLAGLMQETYSTLEVESVISQAPERMMQVPRRLEAVHAFSVLAQAPALAAANKRVGNILKKVDGEVQAQVHAKWLVEPAEIALNNAVCAVKPHADSLFESGDYTASLQALAALKAPVDDFFDHVMVNTEDPALKANRLGLLATLHQTMNRVADLSKLAS